LQPDLAAARFQNAGGHQEQFMDAHTLTSASTLARKAKTPFPGENDAYRKARETLLAEEIEFRRHMTRLAEQRRALPPGPIRTMRYNANDEIRAPRAELTIDIV
jgi:hypothetical protein